MKLTKLSLVAALAMSASFGAEVSGKLTAYSYDVENSTAQRDAALTVSITEELTNNIKVNATVVAVDGLGSNTTIQDNNTLTTEANIEATFGNTTVKAGRQYIESPMFYSFDWLMKPVAYEAVAVINTDIANTTLVAVDANEMAGNTATAFSKLNGTNRAYGAMYAVDGYTANAWFYDIEHSSYEQTYVDATKTFGNIEASAQYASTDYETGLDSTAYGIKATTNVAGIDVTVAASDVDDKAAGYVGGDSIYTSSWNYFASDTVGSATKISASKEIAGISTEVSYANYEGDDKELDIILGYSLNDKVSIDAIYTDTNYNNTTADESALEVIATYSF